MRIGVNSGSVEKRYWDLPKAEALVASALHKVEIAEEMDFFDFKVSLKASHVPEMVEANKKFREHSDAPLHLGVTEAGTKLPGAIKSAAALDQLLPYGIGDTIRISLAEDPVEEIPVAPHPLGSRPQAQGSKRHSLSELRAHARIRRYRDGGEGRGGAQALRGSLHRRRHGLRGQRSW